MKQTTIIRKVAVLGAGVMGAQIAAHMANCGVGVVLFDLPSEGGDKSAIARKSIAQLAKLKPAPLAVPTLSAAIQPANYDENLSELEDCDLIIEAIAERMEWKKQLFDTVEPHIAEHAIIASNTSGLSINELATVLSDDLKPRFLGMHFFNPPRYMHLLELIPGTATEQSVVDIVEEFCVTTLGKGVVIARDTPNFIGNRVGVFNLLAVMHHAEQLSIPFEVVDQITGKPLGRPKSGTFRTADVVGLDTLGHVINTMESQLPDDSWASLYITPAYITEMIENGALGQKTRKGIYINKGKQVFSPQAGEYVDANNKIDDALAAILAQKSWPEKAAALKASDNAQARFVWSILCDLFHYCIVNLEDIAGTARDVDFAIRWGFGWQQGPFEIMQLIGWQTVIAELNEQLAENSLLSDAALPDWAAAIESIYTDQGAYSPEQQGFIELSENPVYQRQRLREDVVGAAKQSIESLGATIFENESVRLWDGGDDVAVLTVHTKMGTVGTEVLASIVRACEVAEENHAALVLWRGSAPFSLGANLKEATDLFADGKLDRLFQFVADFQHASMALKHCFVPTVAAVDGMALGGGCEFQMHAHRTVATLESYIGLVEAGVGLLPAGGGLKELALKAVAQARGGDLMPHIAKAFEAAAMAKTSISGLDAKQLGLMAPDDIVIANPHELLHVAKAQALALSASGFRPSSRTDKIKVAGKPGCASLMMQAVNMLEGHFISEHDYNIAERIATILTGGDVEAGSLVTQDWLLKLEREHFCELLQTEKTQQRIAHTLKTGKPLRN